jgi:hypothetical protein
MAKAVLKSPTLTREAQQGRRIHIIKGFHQPELRTSAEMEVYHASMKTDSTAVRHIYLPLSPKGKPWASPVVSTRKGMDAFISPLKSKVNLKRKLEDVHSNAIHNKRVALDAELDKRLQGMKADQEN